MKARDVYTRKVSAEEAREGYILVLKSGLRFFPKVWAGFELIDAGRRTEARVESRACTCRGRDLPHEHYFIRRSGLAPGDRVEIEKDSPSAGQYSVRVRR